jgi:4-amino-4-deoxy-L-arabinose transferase-like glycosyltransferase
MTIDAPYTCLWGWALVLGHRAIFRGGTWVWPVTGLVVGLGILAKYTMLLWLPAVGLFLLTSPAYRRLLLRPGFWVMTAIAAACCLPILFWNMSHEWVSWRHVGGQAGVYDTPGVRWLGPFVFVAGQFGLLLGYWFVVWALAMVAHRPWREPDLGVRYLWWTSAVMFGVFFAASIKTEEEPNWPVTADRGDPGHDLLPGSDGQRADVPYGLGAATTPGSRGTGDPRAALSAAAL